MLKSSDTLNKIVEVSGTLQNQLDDREELFEYSFSTMVDRHRHIHCM